MQVTCSLKCEQPWEKAHSSAKNIHSLWKLLVNKKTKQGVKGHLQIDLYRQTSSDSHVQLLKRIYRRLLHGHRNTQNIKGWQSIALMLKSNKVCQRWVCSIQAYTLAENDQFDYCVRIKINFKEEYELTSFLPIPLFKLPVLEILLKPSFCLCLWERSRERKTLRLP